MKDVSTRPDEPGEVPLTVDFFQGELLGLPNETEDHKPGNQIEPGVETDYNQSQRIVPQENLARVHLQAPVAVMTPSIRGNVMLRIPAIEFVSEISMR